MPNNEASSELASSVERRGAGIDTESGNIWGACGRGGDASGTDFGAGHGGNDDRRAYWNDVIVSVIGSRGVHLLDETKRAHNPPAPDSYFI